jgi:hypothetical protein
VQVPLIWRVLVAYSSRYMRQGFDGLIAMAEERSHHRLTHGA